MILYQTFFSCKSYLGKCNFSKYAYKKRPILRGRDIKRYGYEFADLWIINSHNGIKEKSIKPINIEDFPAVKNHLDQYYLQLKNRYDKGNSPYNLRNCAYMDDFSKQKIIWIELTDKPNFALDNHDYFINNTIFFLTGYKLKYLLAFLNSNLCKWYFKKIAATSGVGTTRWIKQYIEQIFVPEKVSPDVVERINLLVDEIQQLKNSGKDYSGVDLMIEEILNEIIGLTDKQIKFISSQ